MKRKFIEDQLRALGVTDEAEIKKAVDKIMEENGNDITPLRTQIANLEEDIKVKEGVIETKNTKIKELEDVDIESIKTAEYEKGKAEGSKEVEEMKFNTALETALKGFKVKDKASIMGHLDMKTIGREKDESGNFKITGLEDQIKTIKEKDNGKYSYLFEEDDQNPPPYFSSQQSNNSNANTSNDTLLGALKEKFNQN